MQLQYQKQNNIFVSASLSLICHETVSGGTFIILWYSLGLQNCFCFVLASFTLSFVCIFMLSSFQFEPYHHLFLSPSSSLILHPLALQSTNIFLMKIWLWQCYHSVSSSFIHWPPHQCCGELFDDICCIQYFPVELIDLLFINVVSRVQTYPSNVYIVSVFYIECTSLDMTLGCSVRTSQVWHNDHVSLCCRSFNVSKTLQ